jgi:hypothetical protein
MEKQKKSKVSSSSSMIFYLYFKNDHDEDFVPNGNSGLEIPHDWLMTHAEFEEPRCLRWRHYQQQHQRD